MITYHFKTFDELTTYELYKILQLRMQVFVVEQNAAYQDCDNKDLKSLHVFGSIDNEIVCYARGIPAHLSYEEPCLSRVVTSPKHRGNSYGAHIVYLTLEAMKTHFKTSTCRISAQLYLQKFYEGFGFQRVSEVYLEDNIPHVEMLRN